MLSEYFTISNCVFNFSFLSLLLYEILGWSQIYIRWRYNPLNTPSKKFFICKTSTLGYLITFLISTFQLQQFPRYYGGPKFTIGGLCTLDVPQRRNFCTISEYFTISKCLINFSFLSLVLYEILGGPIFTLGGPVPPEGRLAEKFCYTHKYLPISV